MILHKNTEKNAPQNRKTDRSNDGGTAPNREYRVVYVDRSEFCRLIISRRNIRRFDVPEQNVCGLVDVDQRTQFLICCDDLFDSLAPA